VSEAEDIILLIDIIFGYRTALKTKILQLLVYVCMHASPGIETDELCLSLPSAICLQLSYKTL